MARPIRITYPGNAYLDMDEGGTLSSGDLPVKKAIIQNPGAKNFVSYSRADGFYATVTDLWVNPEDKCHNYSVTGIHPQTMSRQTVSGELCEPPYQVTNLNLKLADANSTIPDKTPPVISMNIQVAPGQGPDAKITAGSVPVGTELQVPVSVIDQGMGTATITVQAPGSVPSAQLNQEGFGLYTPLTADKPPIYRYTYLPQFGGPIAGSEPGRFRPDVPGVYILEIEATDAEGNKAKQSKQIRAVAVGATPDSIEGAPVVDEITPANGATDIMVTTTIIATFSEPVNNVTSATFRLIDKTTGMQVPAYVTPTVENGKVRATLTPKGNLFYDRKYDIILTKDIESK